MLKGVSGEFPSWNIRRHASLDSTNAEIKRLIAGASPATSSPQNSVATPSDSGVSDPGLSAETASLPGIGNSAPEGTVAVADVQEGGYGRQGRLWASPLGGLYCSLLLRPGDHDAKPAELPTLSLVIALAVCEALEAMGAREKIEVKWPNDILCSAGKLCGISLEAISGAVCIGIGINVFEPFKEVELAGKYNAAYAVRVTQNDGLPHKVNSAGLTSSQEVFKGKLLTAVLEYIGRNYRKWLEQGFSVFQQEFQNRSSLQGSDVRLLTQSKDTIVEGEVVGLDDGGRLLLRTQSGEIVTAESGEAHILQ